MYGTASQSPGCASPLRAWSAAVSLAVAVFAVTTTEMLPIGLLPTMASELGVSEGTAGLSVTIYGIVAGLLAPAMTSRTRRCDRRVLLLVILGVFVVGNAATAMVNSFPVLLLVRLAIGVFHGLLWSMVAAVGIRLVPPKSAARVTAVVLSGISLALVLGVPAGTLLGSLVGWRGAFAVLAVFTALAACAVFVLLPTLEPSNSTPVRMWRVPSLGNGIGGILCETGLVVVGNYAAYTFIAPFLVGELGIRSESVGIYLLAYGVAGVIGNAGASVLVGRVGPQRNGLLIGTAALTSSLVLLTLPLGAILPGPVIAMWGLSYSALPVLLQLAVFAAAPHAREAATSLYVLVFNVSIAVGSLVGAVSIDAASAAAPIGAGAVVCGLSVLYLAVHGARNRRQVRSTPKDDDSRDVQH